MKLLNVKDCSIRFCSLGLQNKAGGRPGPAEPAFGPRPARAGLPGTSPASRCAAASLDSAPVHAGISSSDCWCSGHVFSSEPKHKVSCSASTGRVEQLTHLLSTLRTHTFLWQISMKLVIKISQLPTQIYFKCTEQQLKSHVRQNHIHWIAF